MSEFKITVDLALGVMQSATANNTEFYGVPEEFSTSMHRNRTRC